MQVEEERKQREGNYEEGRKRGTSRGGLREKSRDRGMLEDGRDIKRENKRKEGIRDT